MVVLGRIVTPQHDLAPRVSRQPLSPRLLQGPALLSGVPHSLLHLKKVFTVLSLRFEVALG